MRHSVPCLAVAALRLALDELIKCVRVGTGIPRLILECENCVQSA